MDFNLSNKSISLKSPEHHYSTRVNAKPFFRATGHKVEEKSEGRNESERYVE